jgi:hypothetical protein
LVCERVSHRPSSRASDLPKDASLSRPHPALGRRCRGDLDALALPRIAQARHHARVIALRDQEAEYLAIVQQALRLLERLEQSIWPDASAWAPELKLLHQSIDEALGLAPSPKSCI